MTIPSKRGYRYVPLTALLLLLVALSAVVILPGCGEKEAAVDKEKEAVTEDGGDEEVEDDADEQEMEDWESVDLEWEYTDEVHGFSVSYPEDWECEVNEFGDGCYISSDVCRVSVFGEYNTEGETPEERLERYVSLNEFDLGVPTDRDPSTLTTGTFDGADYVYDFWVSEVSSSRPFSFNESAEGYLYDEAMYVEKDGKLYGFLATYPVDGVDEIGPIVEAMINSFMLPE
ncbi:MAG: hypothetical protein SWK76_01930 [Actinomycetota bacterium]|nr:hypothetical protein [Actinomycetota bacterium]